MPEASKIHSKTVPTDRGEVFVKRYTFVADRIERRTETKVSGRGGGTNINSDGFGNVWGTSGGVRIASETFHDNRIWFPTGDGFDNAIVLDANRFPVHEGQRISLVFADTKRLDKPSPLVAFANHNADFSVTTLDDKQAEAISSKETVLRRSVIALIVIVLTFVSFGVTYALGYDVNHPIVGASVLGSMATGVVTLFVILSILDSKSRRAAKRFVADVAAYAAEGAAT